MSQYTLPNQKSKPLPIRPRVYTYEVFRIPFPLPLYFFPPFIQQKHSSEYTKLWLITLSDRIAAAVMVLESLFHSCTPFLSWKTFILISSSW